MSCFRRTDCPNSDASTGRCSDRQASPRSPPSLPSQLQNRSIQTPTLPNLLQSPPASSSICHGPDCPRSLLRQSLYLSGFERSPVSICSPSLEPPLINLSRCGKNSA